MLSTTSRYLAPQPFFSAAAASFLQQAHLSHLQSAFFSDAEQPQASHLAEAFFSHCDGHCATAVETSIAAAMAITLKNVFILFSLFKAFRGPTNLKCSC
jgi:hypothetical protein